MRTPNPSVKVRIVYWNVLCLVCLLAAGTMFPLPATAQPSDGAKPTVHKLVAPQILETDLSAVTRRALAPVWAEGETVRSVTSVDVEQILGRKKAGR